MRPRTRHVGVLVVALAVLVGTSAAVPGGQLLVVSDAQTGEALLAVPVTEGATVALEYTHSVEKTRVLDAYAVDGDRLEMTRMEFESYGAGLPAGADVRLEDGRFVFDPPGVYDELYVSPGRVAGHRLHVGERTYDLLAVADARPVRLHVEHASVLDRALSTTTRL